MISIPKPAELEKLPQNRYFSDGIREIDFVIVVETDHLKDLAIYLENLQKLGLEYEMIKGLTVQKLFLLIHIPDIGLKYFSEVYDVGREEKITFSKESRTFKYFQTPVSTIPDKIKGEFTNADRIIIVYKILEATQYGEDANEKGLGLLIAKKIVTTAYPLHDGPCKLKDPFRTILNERQLLLTFWSNFGLWYKEAPLDLIKKYFGSDVAFYFAWLQFFNIMLLPMAILGTLIVIINIIVLNSGIHKIAHVSDICHASNQTIICPLCTDPNVCFFKPIWKSCFLAKWSYVFDNRLSVAFAFLMSIWAITFINLWRRRERILQLRWGEQFEDSGGIRQKYRKEATKWKGDIPKYISILRFMISIICCLLMGGISFGIIIILIIIKTYFIKVLVFFQFTWARILIISLIFQSIMAIIFIKTYGRLFYGRFAEKLTVMENPKTKADFNKSLLYKKYFLAFVNNFSGMFYAAFVVGRLYTIPKKYTIPILQTQSCQPLTCIPSMSIVLMFILFFKKTFMNLLELFKPLWKKITKQYKEEELSPLPQYEQEYYLKAVPKNVLMGEFCEMVVEYGFLTFFVAVFPLAPLFAFMNNILEHRSDAYKFVAIYRRIIPLRASGIGPWEGILTGETYLSIITNAFVMGFTSDVVSREVHRVTKDFGLVGYINGTLSAFATKDFPEYSKLKNRPDICWYRAMRFPPWMENKYTLTRFHWKDMCDRLLVAVIFEHVLFVVCGIVSYAIPDIPQSVKLHVAKEKKLIKMAKQGVLNEEPEEVSAIESVPRFVEVGPIIM